MSILNKQIALALALGIVGAAQATEITFSTESISGVDWRYNYTVANNTLGVAVDEFTIYFDRNLYTNLVLEASPLNWDSLVVQPDLGIPSDGFFDSFAFASGIASGNSLAGFKVTFTYLGLGAPGAQPFEIVDASFNTLDTGITTAPATPVPEPASYLLMTAGLAALRLAKSKRSQMRPFVGISWRQA